MKSQLMQQVQTPVRQRRIAQQNQLANILQQLENVNSQIESLKHLIKSLNPSTIPNKFMYNIGGIFVKDSGKNYYKTIQNEISSRMTKKKQLKEDSHRVIALIVTLTKKEQYKLLRLETIKAIEDYREELDDLNDLND